MVDGAQDEERGWRPVPDPTLLTNSLIFREVTVIKELIDTKIIRLDRAIEVLQKEIDKQPKAIQEAVDRLKELHDVDITVGKELIDTKIIRLDGAIEVLQKEIDTRPKAIQEAVDRLKELHDMRFSEREIRNSKTESDSRRAIDAALQASKESFIEQKAATTKQIDQIATLISVTNDAITSKIEDIKSRLTLLEGTGKGGKDLLAIVFTIVGIAIAAIMAIIAFQRVT